MTAWLEIFLFQTDWLLADAHITRVDRLLIRRQLERAFS